jgi:hypothetical protein
MKLDGTWCEDIFIQLTACYLQKNINFVQTDSKAKGRKTSWTCIPGTLDNVAAFGPAITIANVGDHFESIHLLETGASASGTLNVIKNKLPKQQQDDRGIYKVPTIEEHGNVDSPINSDQLDIDIANIMAFYDNVEKKQADEPVHEENDPVEEADYYSCDEDPKDETIIIDVSTSEDKTEIYLSNDENNPFYTPENVSGSQAEIDGHLSQLRKDEELYTCPVVSVGQGHHFLRALANQITRTE